MKPYTNVETVIQCRGHLSVTIALSHAEHVPMVRNEYSVACICAKGILCCILFYIQMRNWKRRFFVLTEASLGYYKSIEVSGCSVAYLPVMVTLWGALVCFCLVYKATIIHSCT